MINIDYIRDMPGNNKIVPDYKKLTRGIA